MKLKRKGFMWKTEILGNNGIGGSQLRMGDRAPKALNRRGRVGKAGVKSGMRRR